MALKGTSEQVKERIFSNLSERAGDNLKEEMDLLGPRGNLEHWVNQQAAHARTQHGYSYTLSD